MSLAWEQVLALGLTMAGLAALPSLSVLIVTSHAVNFGFWQGVAAALGIVTGDMVFILLTLGGLSLLMAILGELVAFIPLLSGAYILGLGLWMGMIGHRAPAEWTAPVPQSTTTPLASFLTGLAISLGDQKAVVFYLGFLPTFVDLSSLTWLDTLVVVMTAFLAVGGVKVIYAMLANRVLLLVHPRVRQWLQHWAALLLIGLGIGVILKTVVAWG
ncbi:MAG: LysE family translocator [Synechococcales cyanobacterium]